MSQIKIGARVTVPTKNVGVGTVAFIGETEFAKGEWIGIILDEKRGKNNGSIQGKAYFTCEHEYGMFVRSSLIQLIQAGIDFMKKTHTVDCYSRSIKFHLNKEDLRDELSPIPGTSHHPLDPAPPPQPNLALLENHWRNSLRRRARVPRRKHVRKRHRVRLRQNERNQAKQQTRLSHKRQLQKRRRSRRNERRRRQRQWR